MDPSSDKASAPVGNSRALVRYLPLLALAGALGALYAAGAHHYFSFEQLLQSRATLAALVVAYPTACLAGFVAIYIATSAIALPGASLLTIAGGVLFGGLVGGSLAAISATCGAALLFLAARASFGEALRGRAGPWLGKFCAGFERNAVSYMLFLRLTPVFPFWLVNLAAAMLGCPLATFACTTFIGILPATFAFAYAGAGLDSVAAAQTRAFETCLASGALDCHAHIYVSELVTRELLFALGGLGMLSLVPILVRRFMPAYATPRAAGE